MTTPTDPRSVLAIRELELFQAIQDEMVACSEELPQEDAPAGGALADDWLVTLVGQLALLVDEVALAHYETWFWSQVRAALGKHPPAPILSGSFRPAIERTERLIRRLKGNTTSPQDARARADVRSQELAAARSEGDDSEELRKQLSLGYSLEEARRRLRERSARPEMAEVVADEMLALVCQRLNAGYLLEGIAQLWPTQADVLTRRLWNEGELEVWDRQLDQHQPMFAPCSSDLRELLIDEGTDLDEERFGVLLKIARFTKASHLKLSFGEEESPALLPAAPWHALLVRDFFLREHPEWLQSGRVQLDVEQGSCIITQFARSTPLRFLVCIVRVPVEEAMAACSKEHRHNLDGLWIFRAEELVDEFQEEDEVGPYLLTEWKKQLTVERRYTRRDVLPDEGRAAERGKTPAGLPERKLHWFSPDAQSIAELLVPAAPSPSNKDDKLSLAVYRVSDDSRATELAGQQVQFGEAEAGRLSVQASIDIPIRDLAASEKLSLLIGGHEWLAGELRDAKQM